MLECSLFNTTESIFLRVTLDLASIVHLALGVVQDGDLLLVTLSVAGVVQRVAGLAPPAVPDRGFQS